MRARAALLLILAGLLTTTVGASAGALTLRVKRLASPAGCIPADAAVDANGALWLVCDHWLEHVPYVLKLSPRGTVTSFGVIPVRDPAHGEVDSFGFPTLTPAPDGSAWISSGLGSVCRAAARTLRCAHTLEAQNEPVEHDATHVRAAPVTAGPDGDAWFTQSAPDGHLPTTVVHVTRDLQLSEFAVPEGLAGNAQLVLGGDGAPWFGVGSDHVAHVSADGTMSWLDLAAGIADGNPIFAAGATPAGVLFATFDASFEIRRLIRVAPDGGQAVAYDVPRLPPTTHLSWPVVVGKAGDIWLAGRSYYPGADSSVGPPSAVVRIDATGARTRWLPGLVGFFSRGPGAGVWAFEYGDRLARWRLITIDRRLHVKTIRTFAGIDGIYDPQFFHPRHGSTYVVRMVSSDTALWLLTRTNGHEGPGLTGLQVIR